MHYQSYYRWIVLYKPWYWAIYLRAQKGRPSHHRAQLIDCVCTEAKYAQQTADVS